MKTLIQSILSPIYAYFPAFLLYFIVSSLQPLLFGCGPVFIYIQYELVFITWHWRSSVSLGSSRRAQVWFFGESMIETFSVTTTCWACHSPVCLQLIISHLVALSVRQNHGDWAHPQLLMKGVAFIPLVGSYTLGACVHAAPSTPEILCLCSSPPASAPCSPRHPTTPSLTCLSQGSALLFLNSSASGIHTH